MRHTHAARSAPIRRLSNLFVRRMFATEAAELFQFQPFGHCLLILGRRIVALLAFPALQLNVLLHVRTSAGPTE
jgi:hypothetical protein